MKKIIALFLTAFMVAGCLTACRTTSRKLIRPLFFHISAQTYIV